MKGKRLTPARRAKNPPARTVVYRSRDFVPVPLKLASASWRARNLLGDSYESPNGGWDRILEQGEGTITREVHWSRPRVILRAQARLVTDTELKVTMTILRGRHTVGQVQVVEKLTAAGLQTAWDIEVSTGRSGGLTPPSWFRMGMKSGVLRGLQAERDHRLHRMLEDAMESS
jgi:hypothetical protein